MLRGARPKGDRRFILIAASAVAAATLVEGVADVVGDRPAEALVRLAGAGAL